MDIQRIDYLEIYVGNLFQACHFYNNVLGFIPIAEKSTQIDKSHKHSILLEQNNIRLLLTSPLTMESPVAQQLYIHGDGVRDIAFLTSDAKKAFESALKQGATAVLPPTLIKDDNCEIIKSTIKTFGDTVHSFIERKQNGGDTARNFFPHFKPLCKRKNTEELYLKDIDHLAICLEEGSLIQWYDFYKNTFNFHESHQEDINTEKSGMKSFVLQNERGNCILTLVEPGNGIKKSQITEFIEFYGSSGVQHIAFSTEDIVKSVKNLGNKGLSFLSIPSAYYEALPNRINNFETEEIVRLKDLNILVDKDKEGILYQIFSKVIQTRPTLFLEIIQRSGAKGFGKGNIKALFEAVEREQATRETV